MKERFSREQGQDTGNDLPPPFPASSNTTELGMSFYLKTPSTPVIFLRQSM